jgi:putative membrane protein
MSKDIPNVQRSLLKGMIAGMIGGLVATVARTYAERLYPLHPHAESVLFTESTARLPEPGAAPSKPGEPIRWGFGALTGAAYGGLVEFYPAATEKSGASFGLVLAGLTQKGLPEPAAPTEDKAGQEQASAMTASMVYGVVTETVRSAVRRFL